MSLVNTLQFEIGNIKKSNSRKINSQDKEAMKLELELFRQKREINYEYDLKLLERRFELEKDLVMFKHELNN